MTKPNFAANCYESKLFILLVTFTTLHIKAGRRLWAFGQMATFPRKLTRINGLRSYKMMGSGAGIGFSIRPNWDMYALLAVWEDAEAYHSFIKSTIANKYFDNCSNVASYHLSCYKTHGFWMKENPFAGHEVDRDKDSKLAVITRASIKLSKLHRFWNHVPKTSDAIADAKGREFSIGVGELPWVQQATFSIWSSEEDMKAYAYSNKAHLQAIKMTKELGWYKEEMFSRFNVLRKEIVK